MTGERPRPAWHYQCDTCGEIPIFGACPHGCDDLPPVCGDCCDDPTAWAEWAATVDDLPNPADRVPCSRCGC